MAAKGTVPWNKGHRSPPPPVLTAEVLRVLVRYDPATGLFERLVAPFGQAGAMTIKGYVRFTVLRRKYMAHRLAWLYMTGAWPREQIDHIDGNRSNNLFSNLREATPLQNSNNRHAPYRNGYRLKLSDAERARRAAWMKVIRSTPTTLRNQQRVRQFAFGFPY